MKDILNSYSVSELKKFISSTNIKGYSKMKKEEIIKLMMKAEHKDKFKNIKMKEKSKKPMVKKPEPKKPEPKKPEPKKPEPKKPEPKKPEPKKPIVKKPESKKDSDNKVFKINNLSDFTNRMNNLKKRFRDEMKGNLTEEQKKEREKYYGKRVRNAVNQFLDLNIETINYGDIFKKFGIFLSKVSDSTYKKLQNKIYQETSFNLVKKLREINPDKKVWEKRLKIQNLFQEGKYSELKKIYEKIRDENKKFLPAISKEMLTLDDYGMLGTELLLLINKNTDYLIKFPPGAFFAGKPIIDQI